MFDSLKSLFTRLRTAPWTLLVIAVVAVALLFPIWPDGKGHFTTMTGYVVSWFGALFKAISAFVVCYWLTRNVFKLNLSDYNTETGRAIAGAGMCVLVGLFVIGVCLSV